MKTVKAKSSKNINDHNLTKQRFEWQQGYGVFSYRKRDTVQIYKYIQNQEEHHSKQTLREEYLGLLQESEIGYDEQYIFQELVQLFAEQIKIRAQRLLFNYPIIQHNETNEIF